MKNRCLSTMLAVTLTLSAGNAMPIFAAVPESRSSFTLSVDDPYLTSGVSQRLYLENQENLAIQSVNYSVNPEDADKVVVDPESGIVSIRDGFSPADGETVTVNADITWYNPDDVMFHDGFEGEKLFTEGEKNKGDSYRHSDTLSHWGRKAATPEKGKSGRQNTRWKQKEPER